MPRLLALLLAGCAGATIDPGLGATLRVAGGQYVAGEFPSGGSGPALIAFAPSRTSALPGDSRLLLSGFLDPMATGVLLGLEGDPGYWVVPAGPPDIATPELLTVGVTASLSRAAVPGESTLLAAATDERGGAGPVVRTPFTVLADPVLVAPLVVELEWGGAADIDLRLVLPSGAEVWARDPTGAQPRPGQPVDAAGAGLFEVDSNARCALDGLGRERVTFRAAPPPGRYVARVDTFSLCGAPAAPWTLRVIRDGAVVAEARGVSVATDTRFSHGPGAGLLALTFDIL